MHLEGLAAQEAQRDPECLVSQSDGRSVVHLQASTRGHQGSKGGRVNRCSVLSIQLAGVVYGLNHVPKFIGCSPNPQCDGAGR